MSNASTSDNAVLKGATEEYYELTKSIGREISKIDLLLRSYYKKYPVNHEQVLTKWNILKLGKTNAVEVFFEKLHHLPASISTLEGITPQEDMITPTETETGDGGDTSVDTYSLVGAPPAGPVPTGPK